MRFRNSFNVTFSLVRKYACVATLVLLGTAANAQGVTTIVVNDNSVQPLSPSNATVVCATPAKSLAQGRCTLRAAVEMSNNILALDPSAQVQIQFASSLWPSEKHVFGTFNDATTVYYGRSGNNSSMTWGLGTFSGGSEAMFHVKGTTANGTGSVTIDFDNRIQLHAWNDVSADAFYLNGKNIVLRNIPNVTASNTAIIVGSNADNVLIEGVNSVNVSPMPGSNDPAWDTETLVEIYAGAKNITIKNSSTNTLYEHGAAVVLSGHGRVGGGAANPITNLVVDGLTVIDPPTAYSKLRHFFVVKHDVHVKNSKIVNSKFYSYLPHDKDVQFFHMEGYFDNLLIENNEFVARGPGRTNRGLTFSNTGYGTLKNVKIKNNIFDRMSNFWGDIKIYKLKSNGTVVDSGNEISGNTFKNGSSAVLVYYGETCGQGPYESNTACSASPALLIANNMVENADPAYDKQPFTLKYGHSHRVQLTGNVIRNSVGTTNLLYAGDTGNLYRTGSIYQDQPPSFSFGTAAGAQCPRSMTVDTKILNTATGIHGLPGPYWVEVFTNPKNAPVGDMQNFVGRYQLENTTLTANKTVSGTIRVPFFDDQVDTVVITVTDSSVNGGSTSKSSSKVSAPEVIPCINLAGGVEAVWHSKGFYVLTAQIIDTAGQPHSGVTVDFSATANVALGNSGVIGVGASCVTDGSGTCGVTASSTVAGTYTTHVTAIDPTSGDSIHLQGIPGTGYGPSPVTYSFQLIPVR